MAAQPDVAATVLEQVPGLGVLDARVFAEVGERGAIGGTGGR